MWISIDLGTSNSCAAYFDGRAPRMIELGEGVNTILPSVVTIHEGEMHVGQDAIELGKRVPDFCFRHFKRKLGEQWNDNEDSGHQTRPGPDGSVHYAGPDGHTYSPVELCSAIIAKLVDAANAKFMPQDEVTGAVICVPADFTQSQRKAVEEAAHLAGLERVELMNEPTAAALAYGYDAKKARRIAVFDLGGGTFDVSIVSTGNGLVDVLTTNGIRDLGGTDFDKRIASYMVNQWRNEHGTDLAVEDDAMLRIRTEAEAAKKRLSEKHSTHFRLLDIDRSKGSNSLHMSYDLDRVTFEDITKSEREKIISACKAAIADVRRGDPNFSVKDLHDVLLVGGMTRVPSIRAVAELFFGKAPRKTENPEQVVAMGAAIRAAIIEGRKPDLTIADILSHSIAIETVGDVAAILAPKGTNYPFSETFTLANVDAGQKQLSIRLVQGEAGRASVCELMASAEVPVEPGPAQSRRAALTLTLDASGRPTVTCGDTVIYGEAA